MSWRVSFLVLLMASCAEAQSRDRGSAAEDVTISPQSIVDGRRTPAAKRLNSRTQSGPRETASVTLLGSVLTSSPAQSFALNGALAYTCDNNEISVVDISNPLNLRIVGTATASLIQNSGDIHCA